MSKLILTHVFYTITIFENVFKVIPKPIVRVHKFK